jgi:hypothetical protein
MAWDMQLEGETGDLVFSPSRDIAGVSGEGLLRQRVSLRCKILKDSYIYDEDGSLGSILHLVPRSPSAAQIEDAKGAVISALGPMSGEISVTNVDITVTSLNQLQVNIEFVPIMTDTDIPTIDPSSNPEFDAISVTVTQD